MQESNSQATHARELHALADSASLNKCNTAFAFFAHLVLLHWYAVVLLLFGPVGHTHAGVDQDHSVHNGMRKQRNFGSFAVLNRAHITIRNAGRQCSPCQDVCDGYERAWERGERPLPCYIDHQWDWDGYYEGCSNEFKGFTKTMNNPTAVHAFKFEADKNGVVRLHYRESASAQQGQWRGQSGQLGDDLEHGFQVFNTLPTGLPKLIEPNPHPVSARRQAAVLHPKVMRVMRYKGIGDGIEWMAKVMNTGQIPIQDAQPHQDGAIGCQVDVGKGRMMRLVQGLVSV